MLKFLKTVVILMAAGVFISSCGNKQQEIRPEYKQITEAVYASGYIMPRNEYRVYSLTEGFLAKKLVEEGAEVTEGEPMFIIQGEQQDIRYENAATVYEIARANYSENSAILNEARSALEISAGKLNNDSINFIRFRNLWETNATSKMELDRAELAFNTSRSEYQMRKQQYEKLRNQLYVELKNAQSQLELTLQDKNNRVLKSNINGMVYQTYKEVGELVHRGEPIALLGQKDEVYLQLSVDELDIKKIKTGQDVLVKADIYGERVFEAKVTKIYPMLNRREQAFRVDAEFIVKPEDNYSGLSVEANIIIAQKEKALVVPRSLLIDQDSIWISRNGKEEKIKLQKGLETLEFIEMLGLDENTTIIIK
jgi:HlyD family secretion protein